MNRLICKLFGHKPDWEEYDKRTRLEDRAFSGTFVLCKRCNRYRVDMREPKLIATGNLLFKGAPEEIMECSIAPPIIIEIKKQLINLCPTSDDTYAIEWHIKRGPVTRQE